MIGGGSCTSSNSLDDGLLGGVSSEWSMNKCAANSKKDTGGCTLCCVLSGRLSQTLCQIWRSRLGHSIL